ncbi:class I SAM-dependent methyltransferase [Methylotenera sp.]|uniref:class I SAM-dependent methyltransferase n=1 Tax=Methylotenera sp. TaxID=2051956 RepID=UPI0027240391|nr:class I SAM-dependent methyltransferase [Methylotenera sp.]MDO9204438.1 class I SAM-dependent methyltransferase [Methylotenera sp.]MDO9394209.1 class I SAM-dependent methyltransferase [Methylotenera sp.]MDP1521957.1 class I SAM-dependent methyltransferase [Methylotenera sp.]MDP2072177.1 class I SAM-dependent methyltransferase [Methylotenera sp.]MDP2231649.1 class I SAM-dependent methyltransferase [Methylotenera sp.]
MADQNAIEPKMHWNQVYATKAVDTVSWFQPHAEDSLRFLQKTGVNQLAAIIDVGGGASTLVDDLLLSGHSNVSVLDISEKALLATKNRLESRANQVNWLMADITKATLPAHSVDVWHDRAVFHFLTSADDRQAYIQNMLHAVKPNGHVIIATFAEDGPMKCSGLDTVGYSANSLHEALGESFTLIAHEEVQHHTPGGNVQQFNYCYFRVLSQ